MKKIDSLLKRVELFERLAVYGDRKSFLQALAQEVQPFPAASNSGVNAPYVPGTEPPVNNSNSVTTLPTTTIMGDAAQQIPEMKYTAPLTFNPNVKKVQDFLNQELAVKNPIMAPIKSDGLWGAETAKAVKLWGDVNKLNQNLSNTYALALSRAGAEGTINDLANVPKPNLEEAKNTL